MRCSTRTKAQSGKARGPAAEEEEEGEDEEEEEEEDGEDEDEDEEDGEDEDEDEEDDDDDDENEDAEDTEGAEGAKDEDACRRGEVAGSGGREGVLGFSGSKRVVAAGGGGPGTAGRAESGGGAAAPAAAPCWGAALEPTRAAAEWVPGTSEGMSAGSQNRAYSYISKSTVLQYCTAVCGSALIMYHNMWYRM